MVSYAIGVIIIVILVLFALATFHESFKQHDKGMKSKSADAAILGILLLFIALVAARITGI